MTSLALAYRPEYPSILIIAFPRAAGLLYDGYAEATQADCIGLDPTVPIRWAAEHSAETRVLRSGQSWSYYARGRRPGQCAVIAGSLDHPDDFMPDAQIFLSDAVRWLEGSVAIPGYAEKPAGMTPPLNYNPVTGKIDG